MREDQTEEWLERAERLFRAVVSKHFAGESDCSLEVRVPKGFVQKPVNGRGTTVSQVPAAQFDAREGLIVLHPHLFRRRAPDYVLNYLLFHEVLHEKHPPEDGGDPHCELFRVREAQAPHRKRALEWLERNGFPTMCAQLDPSYVDDGAEDGWPD